MATLGQKADAPAPESAEWQVWFDSKLPRGLTLEEYKQRVVNVASAKTLSDLEENLTDFNGFAFVPEAESLRTGPSPRSEKNPFRFNLRVFRASLSPFWEDMPESAVIYTLKFPESHAPSSFQLIWKALSRSVVTARVFKSTELVEEDLGEAHPQFDVACLAGVVVHYGRNKGHGNVELWCLSGGEAAEKLLQAIKAVLPEEEYGYVVSSRTKSSVIGQNATLREAVGQRPLRSVAPPSFQRKESVRTAFSPYDDATSTAVRVFEKSLSSGRIAGSGSNAKVETLTMSEENNQERRRGGRGGGRRKRS